MRRQPRRPAAAAAISARAVEARLSPSGRPRVCVQPAAHWPLTPAQKELLSQLGVRARLPERGRLQSEKVERHRSERLSAGTLAPSSLRATRDRATRDRALHLARRRIARCTAAVFSALRRARGCARARLRLAAVYRHRIRTAAARLSGAWRVQRASSSPPGWSTSAASTGRPPPSGWRTSGWTWCRAGRRSRRRRSRLRWRGVAAGRRVRTAADGASGRLEKARIAPFELAAGSRAPCGDAAAAVCNEGLGASA